MKNIFLLISICIWASSSSPQRIIGNKKYYKDFHIVNVEGINEMNYNELTFPYVEISTYPDSSRRVTFHQSPTKKCTKKYQFEKGIFISRYKLKTRDAGCNYFTEIQYYFARGKMITYVFCEDTDLAKKNKVYKVYCEELSEYSAPYQYKFKSTVLHSFEKDTETNLTFNPSIDFNGPFFSEIGAFVNESTLFNKGDSLCEISNSYYIEDGNKRNYNSNINYTSPIKKGSISVWKGLDCKTGF